MSGQPEDWEQLLAPLQTPRAALGETLPALDLSSPIYNVT